MKEKEIVFINQFELEEGIEIEIQILKLFLKEYRFCRVKIYIGFIFEKYLFDVKV